MNARESFFMLVRSSTTFKCEQLCQKYQTPQQHYKFDYFLWLCFALKMGTIYLFHFMNRCVWECKCAASCRWIINRIKLQMCWHKIHWAVKNWSWWNCCLFWHNNVANVSYIIACTFNVSHFKQHPNGILFFFLPEKYGIVYNMNKILANMKRTVRTKSILHARDE